MPGVHVHVRPLLSIGIISVVLSNVLLSLPSWEKCLGYTSAAEAVFSVLGTLFGWRAGWLALADMTAISLGAKLRQCGSGSISLLPASSFAKLVLLVSIPMSPFAAVGGYSC